MTEHFYFFKPTMLGVVSTLGNTRYISWVTEHLKNGDEKAETFVLFFYSFCNDRLCPRTVDLTEARRIEDPPSNRWRIISSVEIHI